MNRIGQDTILILAPPDGVPGRYAERVNDLLESCRHARAEVPAEAAFALGVGPPDEWQYDNVWLTPAARSYVWFEHWLDPEDYTSAADRLPNALFLHGDEGLARLEEILVEAGVSQHLLQVDAAGRDALFELKSRFLDGVREDYERFLVDKPDREPALSAAWRAFLQRLEGSAGTYEFTELSAAAVKARGLFGIIPTPPDTEGSAVELLSHAIDEARARHRERVTERLPARIEVNVRQRVLIVADEPSLSQQLRLALSHSKLDAMHHNVPQTFYEALKLVQPDVLLLQHRLKQFDGLDLAAQLRSDDRFASLPIVALLEDSSEATRNRAARCGVDTFLLRPFSAESAVLTVLNMLRRIDAEKSLGGRDPVTGLYSRKALEDRLDLELLRARRTGELVGFILIHIESGARGSYPRQQLLQLARTVESTFRRSDIIGRYNERTIAGVLPGADPRVIMSLMQRMLDSADPTLQLQIAASIAEGAVNPPMVMADAETRLIQVLEGQPGAAIGRCVHRGDDDDDNVARAPRVLLVDNDEAILTLLKFFCAREGLVVDEVRDGLSAIEHLERSQRENRLPDLVILEAYLPGVDGFSVLRKIHSDYGPRVAVMMLTVQRNEERIAKAFKLGAADFVAKPFSVPEVMARVKNILLRSGAL